MTARITGRTLVAGVVGSPITHSLSPTLHNAWLAATGIDGVYTPFAPTPERIAAFLEGMRGGVVRGLNVTAPFKLAALEAADDASGRATEAGAANMLIFHADGTIVADNTDGEGLLAAFAEQASGFDPSAAPAAILGAGGAARGAAAAFLDAGAPEVRLLARDRGKAQSLAETLGERVTAYALDERSALADIGAMINATPQGQGGGPGPAVDLGALPGGAVVMDMVYRPLETDLLARARSRGLRTVDGLAMLIGQARPSFQAFFGSPSPVDLDVRALALAELEGR